MPGTAGEAAEFVFIAEYRDRMREPKQVLAKELARLKGNLALLDEGLTFVAEEQDGKAVGLVPSEAPTDNVRLLTFAFHPDQFPNLGDANILRAEFAPQFRYVELFVDLQIQGQAAAPKQHNDVLDILVTPLNPPPLSGLVRPFSI
jgi:hypothetical protein